MRNHIVFTANPTSDMLSEDKIVARLSLVVGPSPIATEQVLPDRCFWRDVSISYGGDHGDGVEESASKGPSHRPLVLLTVPALLLDK